MILGRPVSHVVSKQEPRLLCHDCAVIMIRYIVTSAPKCDYSRAQSMRSVNKKVSKIPSKGQHVYNRACELCTCDWAVHLDLQ